MSTFQAIQFSDVDGNIYQFSEGDEIELYSWEGEKVGSIFTIDAQTAIDVGHWLSNIEAPEKEKKR